MRLLILHSRYRSGPVSGENRVVEDEARLLRERGHEVDVYEPGLAQVGPINLMRSVASTIWSGRAVKEVAERIARDHPDVVHVHNLFPALSPAVIRAVPDGVACVMTLHNYRLLCLPSTLFRDGHVCEDCLGRSPWPGVMHGCYQESVAASGVLASSLQLHRSVGSFRRVDLFAAISDFVREKHIQAGFPPERVVVKPNFAWPSRRRQGPGEYFLFVGRLAAEKGVATLLRAWAGIGSELVIAGDGPDAPRLKALAGPSVRFLGPVDPERVVDLLARARAVLVPSVCYEAAGKVVLEGYAAGVPVLASRIGALPEVVQDGMTGLLLPPGEPAAWAEGVGRLSDDALSERMGEAGWRLWKERHGPDQASVRLEELYRTALRRAGGSKEDGSDGGG